MVFDKRYFLIICKPPTNLFGRPCIRIKNASYFYTTRRIKASSKKFYYPSTTEFSVKLIRDYLGARTLLSVIHSLSKILDDFRTKVKSVSDEIQSVSQ